MKNNQRALRRFHKHRIRKKRMKLLIVELFVKNGTIENRFKTVLETPKTCSCWMCGNPRKYHGEKTAQELRAEEKFRLDMKYLAA